MIRRRRKIPKPVWDPVREWDGLMHGYTKSGQALTAEQVSYAAQCGILKMELSETVRREDVEAKATPIGGMQYRSRR